MSIAYWVESTQKINQYQKKNSNTKNVLRPFSWLYWTDIYASRPKIEASWMDGSNRTVLVNERLGHPTGLTIDYWMDDRIFWCDSKQNVIESMNADGSDRVLIVRSGARRRSDTRLRRIFIAYFRPRTKS